MELPGFLRREFGRKHFLIFIAVFFVVLFAYDQFQPPTAIRVSATEKPNKLLVDNGSSPTETGDNKPVNTAAANASGKNSTGAAGRNNTGSAGRNESNASKTALNDTIRFPEPNGTTKQPLMFNVTRVNTTAKDMLKANTTNSTTAKPINTTVTKPTNATKNNTSVNKPKPPPVVPKNTKVSYYFFYASYCATCKTMMPWIEEVGREHPSLIVQMIDLYSGSPYIQRFAVTSTAVSVIVREENGVPVSGTKVAGFMDQDAIENFACTELQDDRCKHLG